MTTCQDTGMERATDRRNDAMRKLRERGWTLKRIADKYGVTRQRVHQIISSAGVKGEETNK